MLSAHLSHLKDTGNTFANVEYKHNFYLFDIKLM